MGQLGTPTILLFGDIGEGEIPPCPFPSMAGRRAGPEAIKAGELPLLLTGCSTRESRHCPLSGQHSRDDPDGEGGASRQAIPEGVSLGELAP